MTQRKKNLFRGLLAAAAAVCLAVLCLGPAAGNTGRGRAIAEEELEIVSSYPYTTVTKVKVNLRAGRSVNTELLRRIPAGAEITVTEKNGNWAHVQYGKDKGWVRTEYIVLKTVKKIKVTPTPTPIPTLTPEEDAGGYRVLKKGITGKDVICLQEALIELGYLTSVPDGNFGEATEKAVIAFQRKNSYPDTGLMDANIQAFLYAGKPLNSKGTAVKINTVSPATGATMRMYNSGTLVAELQQQLKALGYYKGEITGRYDTPTKNAVSAFQQKNGLKKDGLAGAQTRAMLDAGTGLSADATPTPSPTPQPTVTPEPVWEIPKSTVKNGSEGKDAESVQTRLQELGYYRGKVDGKFGRASVNALKNFQSNNGLKADGVAGSGTYRILFSAKAVPFESPTQPPEIAPVTPTAAPAATPTATPKQESVWKTLRPGDSGAEVRQLQENLIQLGYLSGKPDGKYGAKTQEAVRAFQKANKLKVDGTAGPATLKAVYGGKAAAAPTAKPTATPKPSEATASLKQGSTGSEVKSMQEKLIDLGFLTGKADGVYGKKTTAAVKAFQKANSLKADGIAGVKTLAQLKNSGKAAATPTPAVTPRPTAAPQMAALTGRPNPSRVIYANWYTTVKNVCKQYPYCTVYDYATGISWQVHIFSVGAHADFEPVTANDTARMVRAFGGETTWNPKPVWVVFPNGSVYMASTHDTPHGVSHASDNNFPGHSCLHFPRTQEQVTAIGVYATSHQETIDNGWAETQRMNH